MSAPAPSWLPARLAHLRRDRRGLPVPYINQWGAADVDRFAIRPDATVGGDAVFLDDEHETVPDFTKQNLQRQRECMWYGLCQVCGREVPWSRRYLVVSQISVQVIDVAGRDHVSLTEPWLDELCASVALERCPSLIRRRRDEELSLIAVTSPRQVQFAVSTGWIEGPLEAQTRERPAAMWIKVLVPEGLIQVRR